MATIADLVTGLRDELHDDASTWDADRLLRILCKTVRRMNKVLAMHNIHFAKSTSTFSSVVSTTTYALPSDFGAWDGLYNRTDDCEVQFLTDAVWEQVTDIASSAESIYWRVNGTNIELAGTPTSVEAFILYYWPDIDTSAYTTATTTPWSGRMDDPIVEYAALRVKNISEMNWDADLKMMEDMVSTWLRHYKASDPGVDSVEPWLGD